MTTGSAFSPWSPLASFELVRRTDTDASLELQVVDDIATAFRWRAGDQVFAKTLSLRMNLEQEMRAMKIQYKAGSPVRTVTVGKTDWDPDHAADAQRGHQDQLALRPVGHQSRDLCLPMLGNISGAISPVFTIPLDQYTTGSALVYAAIHWFADANVMNIQPILNGVAFTRRASASGTDSGLHGHSTSRGQADTNLTSRTTTLDRNLTGAFLVLRIKA